MTLDQLSLLKGFPLTALGALGLALLVPSCKVGPDWAASDEPVTGTKNPLVNIVALPVTIPYILLWEMPRDIIYRSVSDSDDGLQEPDEADSSDRRDGMPANPTKPRVEREARDSAGVTPPKPRVPIRIWDDRMAFLRKAQAEGWCLCNDGCPPGHVCGSSVSVLIRRSWEEQYVGAARAEWEANYPGRGGEWREKVNYSAACSRPGCLEELRVKLGELEKQMSLATQGRIRYSPHEFTVTRPPHDEILRRLAGQR